MFTVTAVWSTCSPKEEFLPSAVYLMMKKWLGAVGSDLTWTFALGKCWTTVGMMTCSKAAWMLRCIEFERLETSTSFVQQPTARDRQPPLASATRSASAVISAHASGLCAPRAHEHSSEPSDPQT